MNLMTVARRANLGEFIVLKKSEVIERLDAGKAYDAVTRKANLPQPQANFHDSILLMGICSILETFLTDNAVEFLICFPGKLESKDFQLDTLAKRGTISGLLREAAEKQVNGLAYKRFSEMLDKVLSYYAPKAKLTAKIVETVNEVKCTRDIFVHGNGRCNSIYLQKAGKAARTKHGQPLSLGEKYLLDSIDAIKVLVEEFYTHGPAKYAHLCKVEAFRQMWAATHLAKTLPFDKAWKLERPGMVRPAAKALRWKWSHAEKPLYDFFLGIYSEDHPTRITDTIDALRRFPPHTPEGRVITSWFESPFWF